MNKKFIGLISICVLSVNMVGCTALNSFKKDLESDTIGLHRIVKVVAMDGTIIETYESKDMRVSDGQGGTIVLDFDGKRVTIANASVIIEEVE